MATYRESACMNHNRFSFDTYHFGIYCALLRQSIHHRDLLALISPAYHSCGWSRRCSHSYCDEWWCSAVLPWWVVGFGYHTTASIYWRIGGWYAICDRSMGRWRIHSYNQKHTRGPDIFSNHGKGIFDLDVRRLVLEVWLMDAGQTDLGTADGRTQYWRSWGVWRR